MYSHGPFPRKGIARPQSQFPTSIVCERFIYSQDRSTNFPAADKQRPILEIYTSLTDTWMWKLGLWAAQFLFWEYLFQIFGIVSLPCMVNIKIWWILFVCRLEEGVERAEAQLYSAILEQNTARVQEFQVGEGLCRKSFVFCQISIAEWKLVCFVIICAQNFLKRLKQDGDFLGSWLYISHFVTYCMVLTFFNCKYWTFGHFSSLNASEKWPELQPLSRSADCLFTNAHCTGSEGRACPQRLAIPPGLHQGGHSGMSNRHSDQLTFNRRLESFFFTFLSRCLSSP